MINSKRNLVSRVLVIAIALSMVIPASAFIFTTSSFAETTDDAPNAAPNPNMIKLQRATFDTNVGVPTLPSALKVESYPDVWLSPYLIQSNGPVTEEWKDSLRQSGIEIVSYIPDNAFLVRVPANKIDTLSDISNVQWSGIYQPAYKVNPALDDAAGKISVEISFFLDGTNGPLVRFLQDYDVEFGPISNSDKSNNLVVEVDASLISTLAGFADVKWITGYYQPTTCNNPASQLLQSGSLAGGRVIADDRAINGDLVNDGAGFGDGDRMVVSVCDSGIRTTHEVWAEAGKVIDNYVPDGSSAELGVVPGDAGEHGQATASQVCGDAPVHGTYTVSGDGKDGGAFAARMIFQDIGLNVADPYVYPPPDYYHDLFEDAQHGDVANGHIGGATLHSNSWGGGGEPTSGYRDDSAEIDDYVWDNKDFVILFAAGNDAAAQTIGDQAEAKNCIAVGATTEAGTARATFSSQGPAVPDGRLKPDLMAVGEGITTADNSGDTGYWADNFSGTSASTPNLAGHVSLVQQYFNDGWYPTGTQTNDNGFMPSAALVKGALTNGAVPIGLIPNMAEGWGRAHLENSLYFSGDSRVVRYIDYGYKQPGSTEGAGLCTGDYIEYTFGVNSGAQPFRVTMAYSDYKGDPSASVMLVNDLDLMVTGPSGTFYGNNFASGFSQTGVYDDNLNNVECVYIDGPAIGAYTIRIDAENIPVGPQDFALVVSGGISDGYGIVTTDRVSYTAPDTINLVVEDNNNPAGSVNVLVESSLTGDTETVNLPSTGASTGIFTGSINTAFDVVAVDGVLQVNNADTVMVTYSDTDPIHDSIATATIGSFGPQITNVRVENIMGTAAVVKWDTNIPSNSTVYYGTGTDSGLWTDVEGDSIYTTTHVITLTGLSMETLYYFDVAASTQTGATSRDDFGGTHYSFSTVGLSTGALVLYIDDDDGTVASDGTPYNEDWEANFDFYGWTYTRWDISILDTPTKEDMEQCKMVVWVVDEGYPQIGAADRAVLGDYLSSSPDPKLYVIGQDIGWDMNPGGTDVDQAWYETHFHSIFEGDDADGGGGDGTINVIGLAADPISGAYTGGIALDQGVFGAGRFWPDDITNNGGTITWDYSAHNWGGNAAGVRADEAQSIAHTGYPAGYRMVYEAWTHEMMGVWAPPAIDATRSDIMDKSCIWLLGADHPEVTLTYPVGGEIFSGTETITWTSVGSLNTKVFYSINGGQAWNLLYEDPTGAATSYGWDTTTVDDGTTYQIKVLVTGTADLTDYKTSAAFEIDNGVDNTGPAVLAGSLLVDPQPTYAPAIATLTATITDVSRGDSNIADAQYRIDGGTPTTMNPADVFDSAVEGVTISLPTVGNGDHTLEVRGMDAASNWGGWSSVTIWTVVNPDPLPVVTVLDNNGQGEDGTWSGLRTITWTATDDSPLGSNPINISYSDNAGGSWNQIATNEINDGAYSWDTTLGVDSANYLIKVECEDNVVSQTGFDESDATFYIDNDPDVPVVAVDFPNGGEFLQIGQTEDILWTASDADPPPETLTIDIEYCNDWPVATWQTIATGETNDGVFPWLVPEDYTTTARVRVTATDTTPQSTSDTSDGDFEIGREYFLQVDSTMVVGFKDLNTDLFEASIQHVDTGDISAPGLIKVGTGADDTWVSEQYTLSKDLTGTWEFSMYGQLNNNLAAGFLKAIVYQESNDAFLFETVLDDEDVTAFVGADHEFVWTHDVSGVTLLANDRFYVEIWLDATAGGGGSGVDTYVPNDAEFSASFWIVDAMPPTGANLNSETVFDAAMDTQASTSDDSRALSVDPANNWDEIFTWCDVTVSTDPAIITQIDLTFEGQGNAATDFDLWVLGPGGWAATGDSIACAADTDGTLTGTITVTPGDYIIGGLLTWGVYQTDSNDLVRVDLLETVITYNVPAPVFTLGYDHATTPSSVTPILNTVGAGTPYNIDLTSYVAGDWAFISFPYPMSGNIETVLDDSVTGGDGTTWDVAKWYNPQTPDDPWKTYRVGATTNDFTTIDNTMGVWIHLDLHDGGTLTTSTTGDYSGATVNIDLFIGWNLVSYPSASPIDADATLPTEADFIAVYNDAFPYLIEDFSVAPGAVTMSEGNAYWVHVTGSNTVWNVAP